MAPNACTSMPFEHAVSGHVSSCNSSIALKHPADTSQECSSEQKCSLEQDLAHGVVGVRGCSPVDSFPSTPSSGDSSSGMSGISEFSLGSSLSQQVRDFCRTRRGEEVAVLLTAFRAAQFRFMEAPDAVVGLSFASLHGHGKSNPSGAATKHIRVSVQRETSFSVLLEQVLEQFAGLSEAKDTPLDDLPTALFPAEDVPSGCIVKLGFAAHGQESDSVREEHALAGTTTPPNGTTQPPSSWRLDLQFQIWRSEEQWCGLVDYDANLFSQHSIAGLMSTFTDILRGGLAQPYIPISVLALSTGPAYLYDAHFTHLDSTAANFTESIYDAFWHQVAIRPSGIAVKDAKQELTFSQLGYLSKLVSNWLLQKHYTAETIVGVLAPRCVDSLIMYIGILGANHAYLPLDIKSPADRLSSILASVGTKPLVLFSTELQPLAAGLTDAECVPLSQVLDEGRRLTTAEHVLPTHANLAAVIFTSGSSGTPKGVMLEHRSVVRVAREKAYQLAPSENQAVVAHLLNPAFDAAMMEIYTALLNGHTLYCVDESTLLDSTALAEAFRRENVEMAVFTPALLKQCLRETPETFSTLQILVVGGDRFKASDGQAVKALVRGEVFNGYGPTENTVVSTLYRVSSTDESCSEDLPIGTSVAGSVAFVMDLEQRLVPPGVIGELVVAGSGLARGYLDPQLNADRFVEITMDGKNLRAYRTGDLARLHPEDMQLQFMGRISQHQQVKIRGHRIELAEIDRTLLRHAAVSESTTITITKDELQGTELVSFVTQATKASQIPSSASGTTSAPHDDSRLVRFDGIYSDLKQKVEPAALGRDFAGWTSMYDGSVIPTDEMEEWLNDTISTIINSGRMETVLEIGTGSGMILFNLANKFNLYIGLDLSLPAVDFVNQAIESLPTMRDVARVHQGSDRDAGQWVHQSQPDLVVVNSVAHYFPSADYLHTVIENCVEQLHPERRMRLFFGDMRSYAQHHEFFVRKVLQNGVGDQATVADVQESAFEQESIETELLVDPAFFTALVNDFDGCVEHVEILPKQMKATNELSCYRYAAVLHIKGNKAPPLCVHHVDDDRWQDFQLSGLDKLGLQQHLSTLAKHTSREVVLALSNIPHSKTIEERLIVDAYDASYDAETHKLPVMLLLAKATRPSSLSALDLVEVAQAVGLEVEISWARQYSQRGGFDAIFHRRVPLASGERARPLFSFPHDDHYREGGLIANTPFCEETQTALRDQLETWVRTKLPPYMTPTAIIPLERMPLTNNGKLDHRALAQIGVKELMTEGTGDVGSLTPKEAKLQELWAQVLGISPSNISVNDHFMRKGGDSIKAMRLIAAARRQGLVLTVVDVMTSPRLRDMATVVSEQAETCSTQTKINETIQPFELLASTEAAEARRLAAMQCQVPEASIEDVLPCTPLQAGLMALNMATPTDYVIRILKDLHPDVDLDRFRNAFDELVRKHPILRTRIIDLPQEGFVQVITSEAVAWTLCEDVEDYVQRDRKELMGLEKPLVRVALVKKEAQCTFIWTMHHAIHDDWSVRSLLDSLQRAYRGTQIIPPHPYQAFVKGLIAQRRSQAAQNAWLANLNGHEADQFPRLPSPDYKPRADSAFVYKMENLSWDAMDVTAAVAIRATWGIMVCSRENVQDVIFGTTVNGRDGAAVPGIEEMTGPTIATIPTRMQLPSQDETLGDLAVRLQREWASLAPYEQVGLQHIRELSEDAARAVAFQTLLVVQPAVKNRAASDGQSLFRAEADVHVADNDIGAVSTYAVVVQFQLRDRSLDIRVTFDSHVVSKGQVRRMFSQYESILRGLCTHETRCKRLSEIEWLSELDMHDIWMWNDKIPVTIESTVHDLLAPPFAKHPEAEAVCAWDGSFTYGMLNEESSCLAHKLLNGRSISAAPVPILLKKSKWVSVAILAVMKAGGTCVLLDATLPAVRLQDIIDQLCPKLMLVSEEEQALASTIFSGESVVIGSTQEMECSPLLPETMLPVVSPETPLYIIFTSGSTGKPKGCVISHRSFSSAIVHEYPRRSISSQSRVFDFSSSAFDGAWYNLLHTLYAGGTICVPSESDRKDDLKGSILRLRATTAAITPTVADTLDAETLESLDSLEIGGEAMDLEVMRRIQSHTHVRYIYGPSECTPICSMTELDGHPTSLGRGTGVLTWLVDPQQSDRLASIGSVAELWLEGPLVGSGYYNDPARTNATFVVNPPWMTRNRPGQLGRTGRAYRTGDLVRYQDDGSLEFIGRATTQQVKIRGQRVELGDVQHHVRQILRKKDPDVQVIADVAGEKRKILVAFVWSPVKAWTDASFESRIQILKQTAGNIKRELAGVIPSYMVPVLFVPVAEIPKTVSGKMDRRKLQVVLLDLDMKQRDACLLDSRESTSSPARPMTSPEKQLASLWAAALNIPEDDIGIDDNFFNRGGDSISAMRLVNAARKHQVVISVKDIWDHPQLKDLAVHMTQNQVEAKAPSDIATGAAPVNRSPASGPLPVTYFQGLSLTGLLGGYSAHVYHILIDIPAETKTEQVRASCLKLFQHFDILRARFACTLQRTWQYLDAEDSPLPWEVVEADSNKGLESATKQVCSKNSGAPQTQYPDARSYLTRFVFVQASQHDASSRLILRLSHAQYDGISLPRMLAALADYLRDGTSLVPAPRYADYIQHVFSQNPAAAYEYWRGLLEGADSPTVLPACHRQDANDVQLLQVSRIIQEPSPHGNEIAQQQTPAVRFMAACAAMLSQATSRQDVVFGCIVSGRTSLPAALREVCGPCLNEIALRVAFPHSSSSSPLPQAAYSQIRNQLLDSAAYDTVGFDEIAAHCTSWAPDTDDFGLTAHYQNTGSEHDTARLPYTWYEADRAKDGLPVPKSDYVEVEGTPLADGRVSVCVMGKSSLYTLDFLQHLLDMVCDGLRA